MRRLVTKKRAAIKTINAAQLKADALPAGPQKTAAQANVEALKIKIAGQK